MTVCDGSRSLKKVRDTAKPFPHGSGARMRAWYGRGACEQESRRQSTSSLAYHRQRRAEGVDRGQRGGGRMREGACRECESGTQNIFDAIFSLMDENLVSLASTGESKALYFKMKGDYHRYLAESSTSDAQSKSAEDASAEATKITGKDLVVTHPIRLGLALNFFIVRDVILQ